MKAHVGADEFSGLVHHVRCTAANVADVADVADLTVTQTLLHSKEASVFGDSGYTGADKREEPQDCEAAFCIAAKRSTLQAIGKNASVLDKHVGNTSRPACARRRSIRSR